MTVQPAHSTPLLGAPVEYAAHEPRLLSGPPTDRLADHVARFGSRPPACGSRGEALLDVLQAIGLTGRGGGHFPAAAKWRATRAAAGDGGTGPGGGASALVVANGAEGEPASAKDAALLQHRPHLVLDGLASAAEVVGAREAVLWLHQGADDSRRAVIAALDERRAAGLADPVVRVVCGPDRYLTGESSAVVRALSGGPALPTFRRVATAREGVQGRPTLVHNVETLARAAVAARTGAAGYRPSTFVTVVTDRIKTVLEVDPGTTIGEVIEPGWGDVDPPQAVLVGGYGGSWLRWDDAAPLTLSRLERRGPGPSLGAGVLAPLPRHACGLAETAAVLTYLARSGARQCGPCLFGLPTLAELVTRLAAGEGRRRDVGLLRRYGGEIEGRGACHHPDGAVRLLRSALDTFAADVTQHLRRGRCLPRDIAPVLPMPVAIQPFPAAS